MAIFALALGLLGACSPEASQQGQSGTETAAEAPGYTLEVFAQEGTGEQVYLVSHADGRAAAAQVLGADSRVLEAERAREILGQRRQAFADAPSGEEDVSVNAPGFSLSISGDGNGDPNQKDDNVRININAGGHGVTVNADENAGDGRANVRVTGADEETTRDFINDAEDLSPEVKAAMLQQLGL